MKTANQKPTLLSDYKSPNHRIDSVFLTFKLHPTRTIVTSKMTITPLKKSKLFLDGIELKLKSINLNGSDYLSKVNIQERGLYLGSTDLPDKPFILEIVTEINPKDNTSLEGLYISNGMYCTQCEAEGFRKITYYQDRPDIMSKFKVRVESDLPVRLSNGNKTNETKDWSEWEDPWPKPSYLFALVAGKLLSFDDHFVTKSGKRIILKIWVREEDINKCAFAMDALKRSMSWDEINYDREYDLDIFQIVAVNDFNMGAMENKGLNIFNSKYVLASPETATDSDYRFIEGIIAHEYFHNWTGNRITCRDWFQLSLKEGLTVFRDQQFSADENSYSVQRINDVIQLRNRQFAEDSGPLSHPVRPQKYTEINNFYTATIYEKGAELINMLHKLVGPKAYKETLNLYFERHDGEACTIDDWIKVFEDHNKMDLEQFKLWYDQAGTPIVTVDERYENETYTLKLCQQLGKKNKNSKPLLIPISFGLLNKQGTEIVGTKVLTLFEKEQEFKFDNIKTKPFPSILRDFSAPIIINHKTTDEHNAFMLRHDTNEFNKWEFGQKLARTSVLQTILKGTEINSLFASSIKDILSDKNLDAGFKALLLKLPTYDSLIEDIIKLNKIPDPVKIHQALQSTQVELAQILHNDFNELLSELTPFNDSKLIKIGSGKRDLYATLLKLNTFVDGGKLAYVRFNEAKNMTDIQAAFIPLMSTKFRHQAVNQFYEAWKTDKLVIDKWFALQTIYSDPENVIENVKKLSTHIDFAFRNPNRVRSLISSFCSGNPAGFHDFSGNGYKFTADWVIKIDKINPQTAARLCTAFQSWRKYDTNRQNKSNEQLNRILLTANLSRDTKEMIDRILSKA